VVKKRENKNTLLYMKIFGVFFLKLNSVPNNKQKLYKLSQMREKMRILRRKFDASYYRYLFIVKVS